jgi:hypothetical protein
MEKVISKLNTLTINKTIPKKKYYVFFDVYEINDILKKCNMKRCNLTQIFKPKILLDLNNTIIENTKIKVIITEIVISKNKDFICAKIILPENIESFYEPSFIVLFIKDGLPEIELKNYKVLYVVNSEIEGIIQLNKKKYAKEE